MAWQQMVLEKMTGTNWILLSVHYDCLGQHSYCKQSVLRYCYGWQEKYRAFEKLELGYGCITDQQQKLHDTSPKCTSSLGKPGKK